MDSSWITSEPRALLENPAKPPASSSAPGFERNDRNSDRRRSAKRFYVRNNSGQLRSHLRANDFFSAALAHSRRDFANDNEFPFDPEILIDFALNQGTTADMTFAVVVRGLSRRHDSF